jgi:hypothetical protein
MKCGKLTLAEKPRDVYKIIPNCKVFFVKWEKNKIGKTNCKWEFKKSQERSEKSTIYDKEHPL